MSVATELTKPTARVVILAEITAGIWCRAWIVDGTFTNSYKVTVEDEISAVRWNRDTLLTQRASATLVNSNAGSWFWDRSTNVLWVRPPSGSIFDNVVQAVASFYFGHPISKTLNDRFYDPRLLTAPALSRRIEAMFGDAPQTGGGSMVLANADGFFDARCDYQWNAGSVTLKIGVDTHAGDMAWADYETAATWAVDEWTRDEKQFTLRLVESKSKLKTKVPFSFFTRAAYPNLEDDTVGKPLPTIYGTVFGVPATLVDPGLKRFVVAGHEIFELTEVRIQRHFEETKHRTIAEASWLTYSTGVFRYYLPDEEFKSVSANAVGMVEANDLDDCIATASRWYAEDNFIYVHPSGSSMFGTYIVTSVKQIEAWDNVPFASKNLALGEFTLGEEWSIGQGVSVDLKGKRSAGSLIENSIDIIENILASVGATNLNAASFTAAAAKLLLGTTFRGRARHIRSVGVVLRDPKDVGEVIGEITEQIGAFIYSDELGQFTVGLFDPQPGEGLTSIDDQEILSFSESNETKGIVTSINANFATREQDEFAQNLITEDTDTQSVNDQAEPVVKESELFFATLRDARDYSQRTLLHLGSPLKLRTLTLPWTQWLKNPGEQVRLTSTFNGIDEVMEIIETRLDLGAKKVTLRLGNLRAHKDTPGFWVATGAVLPTRFATLTGYAAGSLVWNSAWDDEIKTWARQNVGYWTDANGFADSTDPDSFITSTWI